MIQCECDKTDSSFQESSFAVIARYSCMFWPRTYETPKRRRAASAMLRRATEFELLQDEEVFIRQANANIKQEKMTY